MRILIDTNILIPLEPTRHEEIEDGSRYAARLVRLVGETHHNLLIHPNSLIDLQRDTDRSRRRARQILISKYPRLDPFPVLKGVERVLGTVSPLSNDWVDHSLLAAVHADAVDVLVTQDGRMHRKANRLGIADRVVTVQDAITQLEALHQRSPAGLPSVEFLPVHMMNSNETLFSSFRADYPNFDDWLTRCKRQGRKGWLIHGPRGGYAAISIVKEKDDDFALGGNVIKLCTFKVSDEYQGHRYGELLLKAFFNYCHENSFDHAYVTIFKRYDGLINLLQQFGFYRLDGAMTGLGEQVYAKDFRATPAQVLSMDPLSFHVRFGPPSLKIGEGSTFVVPIQPEFHVLLFPDAEAQGNFPIDPKPYGNALRKAYLCHAPIRKLDRGDTLLFYRSHDIHGITAIGVVEETLVSDQPDEIIAMVGQRTVYSIKEINALAGRDVLTILFRQDRLITHPIFKEELIDCGALKGAPQTITSINSEAAQWIALRLGETYFSQ